MAELTSKLYIAQAVVKWDPDSNDRLSYSFSDSQAKTGTTIFNTFQPDGTWTIGSSDSTAAIQYQIYQFGIQTLPGVRVLINSNDTAITTGDYRGVMVGQTGIFELDLHETTPINCIQIENLRGQLFAEAFKGHDMSYCYIDLVYGIISITNTSAEDEDPSITPPDDEDQEENKS